MECTATASSNASTIAEDEKGGRAFAGPPWFVMRSVLVGSRGLRFHGGGDGSIHQWPTTSGSLLRGGRGGGAVIVTAAVVFVVGGFTTGEQGEARDGEAKMDE